MSNAELSCEQLPIVLVRGWGGPDIKDEQLLTYQGFNIGTVYPHKKGENYIYEGLILRFIKDRLRPYLDATNVIRYSKGEYVTVDHESPLWNDLKGKKNSLWVYRYYDFERRDLEFYGEELKKVVDHIKSITRAERVNIIAHSFGGLITRWLLQRVYETREKAHSEVNKVVTLGTPHGGINFAGWAENLDLGMELKYFDRDYLDENLGGSNRHCQDISESFDPKAMLCVVGTDWKNYAIKLSKLMAGKKSDGLVRQANAAVEGAHVAYVHKCHGGNDSLVTSREAYELATRFFFGDMIVTITQLNGEILGRHEPWFLGKPEYYIGFSVKARGLDFFLNQQSKEAENCYGPFNENRLPGNLVAFKGFLDRARVAEAVKTYNDMAWRFDIYIGERDSAGVLGFSDTIVLEKHALFRYLPKNGKLEFYLDINKLGAAPDLELDLVPASGDFTGACFEEFDLEYDTYKAKFAVCVEDARKVTVSLDA